MPPALHLPRAMSHQRSALLSPARFKVLACGRRWGKTALGLLATTKGHGAHRRQRMGAMDGGNVWWVAPTYGVASKIWRDLKRATRDAWTAKHEVERRIELHSGGSVTVRSADKPDTLRGDGLDGLVIDEAAFVAEPTWRDVLRPALSDRRGWAVFISTPNGLNWFHRLYDSAGEAAGWQRWQRPTSDNPVIGQDELDHAREEIGPRAYAQEYEAQFTDAEGAEFSGAYFTRDLWFSEWPKPEAIQFRVMTLDPSKGKTDKSDYSAIVKLVLDRDGVMWIDADLERRDVYRITTDMIAHARDFGPDAVGVEVNQFQEVLAQNIVEASRTSGLALPLHSIQNNVNKYTRIRSTLTPYLARGEFRFRKDSRGARMLVEQLQLFPTAQHDDGPDALEMAVALTRRLYSPSEETQEEYY